MKSVFWNRKMKALENPTEYSSAYLSGLIGENEGRKWLTDSGYEVFEFEWISFYFLSIERTLERLRRRRKPEYKEYDKSIIANIEKFLKGIFRERYEVTRQFFASIHQPRKELHKKRSRDKPDFIIKKNNDFALVEVKANQSMLTTGQRECFKIAKSHGIKAFTLKVVVETNVVKEISLLEYNQEYLK
jgi:hypothetical protein